MQQQSLFWFCYVVSSRSHLSSQGDHLAWWKGTSSVPALLGASLKTRNKDATLFSALPIGTQENCVTGTSKPSNWIPAFPTALPVLLGIKYNCAMGSPQVNDSLLQTRQLYLHGQWAFKRKTYLAPFKLKCFGKKKRQKKKEYRLWNLTALLIMVFVHIYNLRVSWKKWWFTNQVTHLGNWH